MHGLPRTLESGPRQDGAQGGRKVLYSIVSVSLLNNWSVVLFISQTGITGSLEALALFRTEPQSFNLVVTDMTLQKMTGIVLSRKFLKIRPDIPIILSSGISEPNTEEKAKSLGIKAYYMKPFTRKELARVVRQTLDDHNKSVL